MVHPEEDQLVDHIVDAVARYCADHPGTADTVEGVQRWWLVGSLIDSPLEDVERALELLVERGLLSRRAMLDGTCVYFSRSPVGQAS